MSVLAILGLGLLGGAGAVARYVVDSAVSARAGRALPYGTLVVNVTGAFALGIVAGIALDGTAYDLWATGLLGAFTTFSTWMLESHRLADHGRRAASVANLALPLALGLLAVWAGERLGSGF